MAKKLIHPLIFNNSFILVIVAAGKCSKMTINNKDVKDSHGLTWR